MLFFVIGLPGRLAERCDVATSRLVRQAYGSSELIRADTLEVITQSLLHSGSTHGVVASRQPGGRIKRALIAAKRPFIIVRDDPWASLAHLVTRYGVAMPTAVRQVASSCAAIIGFSATIGAFAFEGGNNDPLTATRAIADHLQLKVADIEIADLVRELESGEISYAANDPHIWHDTLDPRDRNLASGALGPYLDGSPGGELEPIIWGPELFFAGDRPEVPATGEIDITGRARCLLRGPDILIPPANWSLAVTIDVSAEAAEHSFVVEAAAGAVISRTVIRPTDAGIVEADLTLVLEELPDQPVELLVSNERPAFGGHVSLLGVTLTPHPLEPALASSENPAGDPQPVAQ